MEYMNDTSGTNSISVSETVIHPSYNSKTGTSDVGTIKLNTPLTFGEGVQSVYLRILEPKEGFLSGEAVTMASQRQDNFRPALWRLSIMRNANKNTPKQISPQEFTPP
ncbi:MAG: hypothetical protein J3R72DRAFT_492684 [Linnemannia gamsii]|nr:MAG: hypothetical protein J3R72DRAFT_492684 [Linnemannia gamsii]